MNTMTVDFKYKNPPLKDLDNVFNFQFDTLKSSDRGLPYYPQTNDFFFVVPINLNIEKLFAEAKESKLPIYKIVKLLWFISKKTVTKRKYHSKMKWEFYSKSFTTINSKKTKELFQNDFAKVFKFLKDKEVLTRKPYRKGTSFSYGYSKPYRFQRLKIARFENNKLVQKVQIEFKNPQTKKFCTQEIKPFKKNLLGLDYNLAEKKLFDKYCSSLQQDFFGGFSLDDKFNSMLKYGAYHQSINQLIKFLNGEYYFSRKSGNLENSELLNPKKQFLKPVGRLFTSFSFLNKETRKLLFYDDEKLVQLDVRNCVAFLLSSYLSKGNFNFSFNMLKYISSNRSYAYYVSKIIINILKKHGVELVFEDFKDVLKPFSELEIINYNNVNAYQSIKLDTILFQKDCPSNLHYTEGIYPTKNLLKLSKEIMNNHKTATNSTEKIVSSNNVEFCSTNILVKCLIKSKPKLEPTVEDKEISKTTIKDQKPQSSLAFIILSHYIFLEFLQSALQRELEVFNKIASIGKFYEEFIQDLKKNYESEDWEKLFYNRNNEKYSESDKDDRKLTKDMITALIYARNESREYKKAKRAFIKKFPLVYSLVHELKEKQHRMFANELFNIEAEIMIDKVAKELIRQKIMCFTVHDGIAVKESDVKYAKKTIEEAFLEKLGIIPTIEIE